MPDVNTKYDDFLKDGVSIFDLLTLEEREELNKNITYSIYKKNEYIYKEGEAPNGILYLHEGKVKIFKEGFGGREQIIRMASSLSLIGYRALCAKELHQASAVAIEQSAIWSIHTDFVFNKLLKNPKFSAHIIYLLAKELGFSNLRTVSLTQKHIRGRLAESLLLLIDKYGFESDNVTLKVYLSREDIANLSNMTASNAIRTLSSYANEKIINIDGRKIQILDLDGLKRISTHG